ncbi:MAG TPA: hypothetical protein VJM11_20885 [Nevskiaceae bacterium]|nr:hypothetical protein [Nevskiaceae bacterium]
MERSRPVTPLLPALAAAVWLAACASAPSADDQEGPRAEAEARAARENAENNLAYAKDQASLWLESEQDRCATVDAAERDACAAAAKASYEEQLAAAQRRYDAICRKADADLRAAAAHDE